MQIEPFLVEQWMNAHETTATWNTAETCVDSLRLEELLALSGDADGVLRRLRQTRLDYGDIVGSPGLRAAIAALYGERIGADNVLVANGAIGANFLALFALVEPGDTVVCVKPTYQQLYSVPEALGATVKTLRLRESDGYLPDVDDLRAPGRRAHPPHRPQQPQQPDRRADRRAAAARARRRRSRGGRLDPLRRGLPQAGAGAGHDGAVGGRPLREGRQQRQHEQELLAGRPARGLGRGAAGARPALPRRARLHDHLLRRPRRRARDHRARAHRQGPRAQPRDRAREPAARRRVGGRGSRGSASCGRAPAPPR